MTQDKFILSVGAQVGGCLVDGLGDGVMVQAPGLERDMLRSVCFGLLQVKQCHACMPGEFLYAASCRTCSEAQIDCESVGTHGSDVVPRFCLRASGQFFLWIPRIDHLTCIFVHHHQQ